MQKFVVWNSNVMFLKGKPENEGSPLTFLSCDIARPICNMRKLS